MKKALYVLLVLCIMTMSGCASWWATKMGGGFDQQEPLQMKLNMSETALRIVNAAYDIGTPLIDHSMHVIGNAQNLAEYCPDMDYTDVPLGESLDTWINEDRLDFSAGPKWWFKTQVLLDAMGVDSYGKKKADQQSLCRLEKLVRSLTAAPGERSVGTVCASDDAPLELSSEPFRNRKYDVRIHLMAIDGHYDKKGIEYIKEKTDVYISNWYVIKLAECLNSKFSDSDPFVPVVSVNPYRVDALKQVERLKERSRFIKWVAPAMGFDPSDSYNNEFFRRVKRNGQVIMSHSGSEDAFKVMDPDFQQLWRPPVDAAGA